MYIARIGEWAEALRCTLRRVYDPTTRTPVPWLLTGDAALALQGVQVNPDAIEFRAISPVAVAYFGQFMRPHELPATVATVVYRRGGNMAPSDGWRSNVHQRVVAWSHAGRATWLGRWNIDGVPVQASYVMGIHPDPIALATKAEVRRAHWEGMEVPVASLEYLLAERAMRNDTQATHRILPVMRQRGYDPEVLQSALSVLPSDKASRLSRLVEFSLIA